MPTYLYRVLLDCDDHGARWITTELLLGYARSVFLTHSEYKKEHVYTSERNITVLFFFVLVSRDQAPEARGTLDSRIYTLDSEIIDFS